ncbi:hypothetical protein DQW50_01625 [Halorubrum sp. 48-1-W]|uniref:DUF6603 domain-containing protein n=1 Tax=Halorubrum sp. 48-1-W TaxID=2249761 RepID=UPI000DCEBB3F|nr:DUF6603 domain-containing protein [Halorubrum sp. 48-1-W]RAW47102.1 hypothetical protein DQW50_01625 [Halorubrum sp. 48-1-W]
MPTTQPSTVDAEPLDELVADGFDPIDVSTDDLPGFLGEVLVDDYDYDEEAGEASVSLIVAGEPALSVPGSAGVTFVLGEPGTGETAVDATLVVDAEWELTIESVRLTARVDGDVLRPVPDEDGTRPDHLDVTTTVDVVVDHAWSLDVNGFEGVDLPPAEIGHTGVVIEATDVVLDVSPTALSPSIAEHDDFEESSVDDGFVGLFVGDASVSFPDRWPVSGDVVLSGTAIGSGGLTGTIEYNPDVSFDPDTATYTGEGAGSLGDLAFAVSEVEVEFVQTALSTCSIAGELVVPYFDERVVVDLAFDMDGTLTARLVGLPDPEADSAVGVAADREIVSLEVPGVAAFDVDSFGLVVADDGEGVGVSVAGTLRPHVGAGDAGDPDVDDLDLPTIEVPEVTIRSDGEVDFEGSWIDLPSQRSTELQGVELEVTKLGFGTRDDGWRYVAFGGSIAIVEGIPAGASTEGLRVAWNPDGDGVEVTFDGIGIEFEVPDALAFAGSVAFDPADGRYYGDIDLDLIALDTSISATLIVGRETGPDGEEFTFLGVSLDASLPAGIPLFSTGLSIYGIGGLYAHNMEPYRGDREWYALSGEADESWYHASGEPRVDDFDAQWRPAAGAFAFGAGVTLGTSADNGFALGSDLLLVVAFPGPVVMLEGRADLLSSGADVDAEGALRTLAVLDGDAGNVTFGIDAAYTKRSADATLLDVRAGVEAHYDFTDPTAWYLNLGRREPREDRVRAEALLFTAEGYLMIDADRVATGARVGYDESFEFGPLAVSFEAWIAGHVRLSWQPTHFSGEVRLHGSVELSAFGVGASITADAALGAEALDPFHVHGDVRVALETPWPLPDPEASVSLEWGPVPSPPPVPAPLDGVALGHERVTTRWPLPRSESLLTPDYATAGDDSENGDRLLGYDEELPTPPDDGTVPPGDLPVVPPDVRPELTFSTAVIDDGDVGVNASTAGPEWQLVGDPTDDGPVEARYGLRDVSLERWDADADEWVDDGPVFGSWAPLPDTRIGAGGAPDGAGTPPTANTKLRLWSVNPYDYGRNTGGAWEEGVDRLLGTYPCYADGRCFRLAGTDVGEELALETADGARVTHEEEGWPAFVSNAVPGSTDPTVATVPTDEGELEALMYPAPSRKDGSGGTRSMAVDLDGSHRSVEVTLVLPRDHTHLTATALGRGVIEDADLRSVPRDVFDLRPDEARRIDTSVSVGFERHTVTFDADPGIDRVVLTSTGTFGIVEVCQASVPLGTLGADGVEGAAHVRDQLDRWSDEPRVLAPNERYRLVVDTVVEARGVAGGALADFEHRWPDDGTLREVAYFETSGPPALADVSTPLTPGGNGGDEADGTGADGVRSFDTLSRYVEGSVPESVTTDGERPSTPRPVYRAYDVGVRFGEAYVETLYAMADRDLRLQLYDADDRPVRDVDGRLGSARDPWGKAGSRALKRHDRTWLSRVAGECGGVDEETLPHEDVLEEREPRLVFDPDATLEARLVPALLRETFDDGSGRWSEPGNGSVTIHGHDGLDGDTATVTSTADGEATVALDDHADLGVLSPNDDAVWFRGDRERPDGTYRIVGVDATDGTVTLAGVPDLSDDGTWRIAPEHRAELSATGGADATVRLTDAPGDSPPATWDDYAVTTTLRFAGSAGGTTGVVVRDAPDAGHCYRFEVDADEDVYRLVRLDGDTATTLASTDAPPIEDGRDLDLRIQVIGGRVDVFVDDEPTFVADDPDPLGPGSVGIHLADVQDLVVPEVRIEGFGTDSPVAYRFPFTTSLFADFVHQVHSFSGGAFEVAPGDAPEAVPGDTPEAVPGDTPEAAVPLPDAEPDPPGEAEARAYARIVHALTPGDRPSVDGLDATWLLAEGDPTALLVRSPEPIDWTRTTTAVTCSETALPPETDPDVTKVTDVRYAAPETSADDGEATADGDGSVDVLFAETERPDGHVVERRLTGEEGFAPEPVGEGIDDEFLDRSVIAPYRRVPAPRPGDVGDLPTPGDPFAGVVGDILPPDVDPGDLNVDPDGGPGDGSPASRPSDPALDADQLSAVAERIGRAFRGRNVDVEVDPANPLAALEATAVDPELAADVGLTDEEYELIEAAAADRALGGRVPSREDPDEGSARIASTLSEVASLTAEGDARSPDPDAEWTVGDDGLSARTEGWTGLVRPAEESPIVWETTVSPGASGRAGLLFRLHDETHYHTVAVGGGEVALRRRTGDGRETLRRVPFEHGPEADPLTLRVRADGTTLWVSVDDVPLFGVDDEFPDGGMAGVFTTADDARFTSLSVHSSVADARLLADAFAEDDPGTADGTAESDASAEPSVSGGEDVAGWRVVDEPPYTTRRSRWRTRDGTLEQTSNLYGFVGNRFRQPGTYAVTGDEAWSDYRLSVRLRSEDDDAIGAVFRYRGPDEFYRFSMDHEREYRRLTRRSNGETVVLWADDEPYEIGREYLLTIDCVGDEIVGYLDGERLFAVADPVIDAGTVGVYCRANVGARFEDVRVTAPGNGWVPYHTFESEPALPAGTRVRIADEPPTDADLPAGVVGRARSGATAGRLPPTPTTFRLRGPQGTVGHRRTVPPADAFDPCEDVRTVRSADGTGMVLFPEIDDDVSTLRLRLTYRRSIDGEVRTRNGSDEPEEAAIDVSLPSTADEPVE